MVHKVFNWAARRFQETFRMYLASRRGVGEGENCDTDNTHKALNM